MKYRIRIEIYANGRREYQAQAKAWLFGWNNLDDEGKEICYRSVTESRTNALNRIDLHYAGNNTVLTIGFEYIKK